MGISRICGAAAVKVGLLLLSIFSTTLLSAQAQGGVQLGGQTQLAGATQLSTLAQVIGGDSAKSATNDDQNLPIADGYVTGSGTYNSPNCFVYVGDTASHTVGCAIYTSSAGAASTLLCSVTKTSTWTVGFNSIGAIPSCGTLSGNTLYFIAEITGSANGVEQGEATGTCPGGYSSGTPIVSVFGATQGGTTFPSSFGTNHNYSGCASVYVTLSCVSFCGNLTNNLVLVNFEGGTNGAAPTGTNMINSVISEAGGLSIGTINNPNSAMTFATGAQLTCRNNGITVNGSAQTDSGSLGFQYATGNGSNNVLVLLHANDSGSAGYNALSTSFCFKTSLAQNDTLGNAYSLLTIRATDIGTFCNPQILPNGTNLVMVLEASGQDAPGSIQFATNTTYQVHMLYAAAGDMCQLAMFDTTGAQVGSTLTVYPTVGQHPAGFLVIGITGAESETSGKTIFFDNVVLDTSGQFPLSH